jgi:hypothetical protein
MTRRRRAARGRRAGRAPVVPAYSGLQTVAQPDSLTHMDERPHTPLNFPLPALCRASANRCAARNLTPAFTIAEIRAMVDERNARVNLDQLRRIAIAVATLIAVFIGVALLSANVNYGYGNVGSAELEQESYATQAGKELQDFYEQDTVPFKAFKSFSRPPVRKHTQLNQVCPDAGVI